MAEDLDKPPEDEPRDDLLPVRRRERLPEARPGAELGFPSGPQPPSTYAPRFRMITGALVGVAVGALAATALLLASGRPDPGPAWSQWQPSEDSTTAGAEEIARHVGRRYRLPSGDQLVMVTGGPLRVAGLDLPVRIALQGEDEAGEVKGRAVMYQLCGLGPRCAIAGGKLSSERLLLLRREALELALYSFRYLGGVKNVVALLPPAPGKKSESAMLFRRSEYESALDRPIDATLPSPPPTLNALPDSPEVGVIMRLTDGNVFRYSFQPGQDLTPLLVLRKLRGS